MVGENLVLEVSPHAFGDVVEEGKQAVLVRSGRFVKTLLPGRHYLGPTESLLVVDLTDKLNSVEHRFVNTAGLPFTCRVDLSYCVSDVLRVARTYKDLPKYLNQVVSYELGKNIDLEGRVTIPNFNKGISERFSPAGLTVRFARTTTYPPEQILSYAAQQFELRQQAALKELEARQQIALDLVREQADAERKRLVRERNLSEAKTDIVIARSKLELQSQFLHVPYGALATFLERLVSAYGRQEARNIVSMLFAPNDLGDSYSLPQVRATPWSFSETYQPFRRPSRAEALADFDRAVSQPLLAEPQEKIISPKYPRRLSAHEVSLR